MTYTIPLLEKNILDGQKKIESLLSAIEVHEKKFSQNAIEAATILNAMGKAHEHGLSCTSSPIQLCLSRNQEIIARNNKRDELDKKIEFNVEAAHALKLYVAEAAKTQAEFKIEAGVLTQDVTQLLEELHTLQVQQQDWSEQLNQLISGGDDIVYTGDEDSDTNGLPGLMWDEPVELEPEF